MFYLKFTNLIDSLIELACVQRGRGKGSSNSPSPSLFERRPRAMMEHDCVRLALLNEKIVLDIWLENA